MKFRRILAPTVAAAMVASLTPHVQALTVELVDYEGAQKCQITMEPADWTVWSNAMIDLESRIHDLARRRYFELTPKMSAQDRGFVSEVGKRMSQASAEQLETNNPAGLNDEELAQLAEIEQRYELDGQYFPTHPSDLQFMLRAVKKPDYFYYTPVATDAAPDVFLHEGMDVETDAATQPHFAADATMDVSASMLATFNAEVEVNKLGNHGYANLMYMANSMVLQGPYQAVVNDKCAELMDSAGTYPQRVTYTSYSQYALANAQHNLDENFAALQDLMARRDAAPEDEKDYLTQAILFKYQTYLVYQATVESLSKLTEPYSPAPVETTPVHTTPAQPTTTQEPAPSQPAAPATTEPSMTAAPGAPATTTAKETTAQSTPSNSAPTTPASQPTSRPAPVPAPAPAATGSSQMGMIIAAVLAILAAIGGIGFAMMGR